MKKNLTIFVVLSLLVLPVFGNAQQGEGGQGIHEPGTGLGEPEPLKVMEQEQQELGEGVQNQGVQNEGMQNQGIQSQGMQNEGMQNRGEEATTRMSRVANTTQAMENIATRNQGVGTQIRTIVQNQNQIQEEAENALQTAQKRSGFSRFFLGANDKQLNTVEERIENHTQKMEELEDLKNQIQIPADKLLLEQQINVMEEIKVELEEAVSENRKGFSLFGWLFR